MFSLLLLSIVMSLYSDIRGPQRMNPKDFGDGRVSSGATHI